MNNVNSIESLEEKGYKRRKVDGVDYMVKPYHVPRHILKIEGDKAVRIMGEVREKVLRVLVSIFGSKPLAFRRFF